MCSYAFAHATRLIIKQDKSVFLREVIYYSSPCSGIGIFLPRSDRVWLQTSSQEFRNDLAYRERRIIMWCHRNTRCILPASHTAFSPTEANTKGFSIRKSPLLFGGEVKQNKGSSKKKPPLRFNGIHCVFKFPRHC